MARSFNILHRYFGQHSDSCKHIQKSSSESHIYLTREKQAGTCKSANGFHFAVRLFIY